MGELAALFERVPLGWSEVTWAGRRYGVTRSVHAGGRSLKVYAEQLGGPDVVSANLYLSGAEELRPCEMPAAKVLAFLHEAVLRAPTPVRFPGWSPRPELDQV